MPKSPSSPPNCCRPRRGGGGGRRATAQSSGVERTESECQARSYAHCRRPRLRRRVLLVLVLLVLVLLSRGVRRAHGVRRAYVCLSHGCLSHCPSWPGRPPAQTHGWFAYLGLNWDSPGVLALLLLPLDELGIGLVELLLDLAVQLLQLVLFLALSSQIKQYTQYFGYGTI